MKTIALQIRVTVALHETAKAMAKEKGVSVSEWVRGLIEREGAMYPVSKAVKEYPLPKVAVGERQEITLGNPQMSAYVG